MFFGAYKKEYETRIQNGGNQKMANRETSISDLIQLLGEKEGMIKAGYIYNCYSNRYDAKHEADDVSQEEYKKQKTIHFANYLRAYYQIKVPNTKPKKTPEYVRKTIEQENQQDKEIDKMNYRW